MLKEIYTKIKDFPKSHPILYGFFIGVIVVGFVIPNLLNLYLSPIIAGYFVSSFDKDRPDIISVSPDLNSYLTEISEINVTFEEKGGSGLDKNKSIIKLITSSGNIKGSKNFPNENIISFKLDKKLEPNAYTVEVKLYDRGGNSNEKYDSKFYILENPLLTIDSLKVSEEFDNFWLDKTIKDILWTKDNDHYDFTIKNENNITLTDVNFRISLLGVIKKPFVFYEQGTPDYQFKLGQSDVLYPQVKGEVRELNSCSLRIEIKEMAPHSVFVGSIITDRNMSNYKASWCPSEETALFAPDDGLYGVYEGSYRYDEYGIRYSKSINGNFTGEMKYRNKILPKTNLGDEQLKEQAQDLSQNLLEFARDRKKNEPQVDSRDWDNSTKRSIAYSTETNDLYFERFGLNAAILRKEFLKRGIEDEEFRRLYAFPAGAYPFQTMSFRLVAMAAKLPPFLNDEQLKEQALELSQSLSEFVSDREKNEPQINFKDWDNSTKRLSLYSTETDNIYFIKYSSKVMMLREEFLKRNITDEELAVSLIRPQN